MFSRPSENLRRSNSQAHGKTGSSERSFDDFVLIIPLIRQHAQFSFRKKRSEEKEELVEECLANAFRAYVRLLELGKEDLIYPSVLAKFAVKQVRCGRRVGGHLNSNDILSGYAQLRRNIVLERLDYYDPEAKAWRAAVVEDPSTPIPEQVAFRIDFPAWLQQHQSPKRRVAEALALGYTTKEAAKRFNVSPGRISQLRRDFEKSWQEFQGEHRAAVRQSLETIELGQKLGMAG
jgi:hypothetical protein